MTTPSKLPIKASVTPHSRLRFELVHKIGISPSLSIEQRRRRKKQRAKLRSVITEANRMSVSKKTYAVCMTLTYARADDFDTKNISSFIDKLRKWLLREHKSKLVYAWALERETCLHYHLIIWLPLGVSLERERLSRWWILGSTWLERCRDVASWGSYIAKFAKPKKPFRRGTRLYGYGGLDAAARIAIVRKSMPVWLRKLIPFGEHARRRKGGGWENLDTGEIYFSPYKWSPLGMLLEAAGRSLT